MEVIWSRVTSDKPKEVISDRWNPHREQDEAMLSSIDAIAKREHMKLKDYKNKAEGSLNAYREKLIRVLLEKLKEKATRNVKPQTAK